MEVFEDLFRIYKVRNLDVLTLCLRAYEYGKNISISPSAAITNGLDHHTLKRQQGYVAQMSKQLGIVDSDPNLDQPATHPILFKVDLSKPYKTFVEGLDGEEKAINEDVQNLSRQWMLFSAELAMCNSAALPSGLIEPDAHRCKANLAAIEKYLDTAIGAGELDLPETVAPDAPLGEASGFGKPN